MTRRATSILELLWPAAFVVAFFAVFGAAAFGAAWWFGEWP